MKQRKDWTTGENGRSNTSDQFVALCDEVDCIIRNSSNDLIAGRSHVVAGLIIAALAHKHGLAPLSLEACPDCSGSGVHGGKALCVRCAGYGQSINEDGERIVELARLRRIVAELTDAQKWGKPGGYIDMDTERYSYDPFTKRGSGTRFNCTYCYGAWHDDDPEKHDDDCPIEAARRALGGDA